MASRTRALPKKRLPAVEAGEDADPPISPSSKKTKAELRRQSLSRAKEWAADRKRKTDVVVNEDAEGDSEDVKKSKPTEVASSDAEKENGENEVVVEKATPVTTRRTTRRTARGTSRAALAPTVSEDVSVDVPNDDESSVSSRASVRRSSRRRTMTAKATEAPAPTRRSRRKTVAPVAPVPEEEPVIEDAPVIKDEGDEIKAEEPELKEEEEETQKIVEEEVIEVEVKEEENVAEDEIAENEDEVEKENVAHEDDVVEANDEPEVEEKKEDAVVEKDEEKVAIEEEKHEVVEEEKEIVTTEKAAETEAESNEIQETVEESEVKEEGKEEVVDQPKLVTLMVESLLSLSPIFLQALVIQWGFAFAIIMMFCLDWWAFQLSPDNSEDILANQRQNCAILGLWLVTILLNFIAFGAKSRSGWALTGASVAVASYSSKWFADINGTTSVPSLPIYSSSGYNVNVLDTLVVLCLVGFASVLKQPKSPMPTEKPQVAGTEIGEEEGASQEPSDEKVEEAIAPEASGPRSLIGQRVAVEKGIDTFAGTVKDYNSETREWLIQYDDDSQEEEELNRVQLGSAFKLYAKDLSDSLREMWRAGEV